MGRRGRYEDVGNCALFLASDLSTYVTGTSLHPDGGVLASSGWFHWPDAGFTNIPPPASREPIGPVLTTGPESRPRTVERRRQRMPIEGSRPSRRMALPRAILSIDAWSSMPNCWAAASRVNGQVLSWCG